MSEVLAALDCSLAARPVLATAKALGKVLGAGVAAIHVGEGARRRRLASRLRRACRCAWCAAPWSNDWSRRARPTPSSRSSSAHAASRPIRGRWAHGGIRGDVGAEAGCRGAARCSSSTHHRPHPRAVGGRRLDPGGAEGPVRARTRHEGRGDRPARPRAGCDTGVYGPAVPRAEARAGSSSRVLPVGHRRRAVGNAGWQQGRAGRAGGPRVWL